MTSYQNFTLQRHLTSTQSWRQSMPDSSYRRNQNTVKFQPTRKLGPVAHSVLVAVMLAVLGLIYLTQITKTSTYGYQINELNTKKEQLVSEQRDLEVETARLQALEKVQQSSVAQALTTPKQTDFVRAN